MNHQDWAETFQVNLFAAVQCTQRLVPAMRAQRWGRVIMIASSAAKYPDAAIIDYAASKAAMIATARALARKYAADSVLINSVLPGLIDTSMWERASAEIAATTDRTREEVMEQMARTVPLGRFGTAPEVADLVLFLVSEYAAYLTGATIDLDGGRGDHIF
jgi:NAD(P)-dependent dehydrogenase (short-subunit alcohol dehydrogenase family)